jgi:hypothetical protein
MQHDVVVPPVILEIVQAGPPAIIPVHHMVRLAADRGLVAAAGMLP